MELRLWYCVVPNSRSPLITQCPNVSITNVFRKAFDFVYFNFRCLNRTCPVQILLIIVSQDILAAPLRINPLSWW